MPKRKHAEIPYAHSYFTRKRKEHVQNKFHIHGKDALPLVASTLDNHTMSNFAKTNWLFHDSANISFRNKVFQYIAEHSEVILSEEVVTIINNLKFPRQVLSILLVRSCEFPYSYSFEDDLLMEYNNPTCWYLLDDNVSAFLKTFDKVTDAKIFIPLALACARFEISKYLLRYVNTTNYQFLASLYKCAVASGHVEMLRLIDFKESHYTYGEKLSANNVARIAANTGSLTMLTEVLNSYDINEFKNGESSDVWDESMHRIAMGRGNIKQFKFLMDFIQHHNITNAAFFPLECAIASGNPEMIQFIIGRGNAIFSRNETEIKRELETAAAQSPEVFKLVKIIIEKKIKREVQIHDKCFIKSIQNGQLKTFEIARSKTMHHNFSREMLDELFRASIKSSNVIVINYILKLAQQQNYEILITAQHLLLAAETNAETYRKIVSLAKQSKTKPEPNDIMLEKAFKTRSSLLVQEVLRHAKECQINLNITTPMMVDAVQWGCVGILTQLGPTYTPDRIHMPELKILILLNPFIHETYRQLLEHKSAIKINAP